ncbi:cyclin-dependent kinase g-1 [Phtheirospermum japonicum]|uniref:Cyclin-dependent kinase g-1 n=1 Tax=Phtheirospermum japonicum TaxID=374723 RepID=A0A830BDZ2_9LAMI|nr:cyclin-dependent kinase g-1 [Phtheirospermum japonicum]
MLRSLKHPSIVEYKQVVADDDNCDIYVVMEYVEYDLHEYMKTPLSLVEVKRLMRELLEGVRFLHRSRVMHRDLKPSNVLVNSKGDLKICDFGMSRHFPTASDPLCSPLVCTLWYRAPELLLGSCTYLAAVDMWSVGCIMAEFFLRKVLFRGESEIQQLGIIISASRSAPRQV